MKHIWTMIALLLLSLPMAIQAENKAAGETITAHVEGMVCDFCAQGLEKLFGDTEAVERTIISLENATVTLQLKPGATLADTEITRIIQENGIDTTSIIREPKEGE